MDGSMASNRWNSSMATTASPASVRRNLNSPSKDSNETWSGNPSWDRTWSVNSERRSSGPFLSSTYR